MKRRISAPVFRCRRRQTGAALILAVLIAGLLLASTAVSLEAFLLTMRTEQRGIERMADFHLADTMLTLCERRVVHAFGLGISARMPAGVPRVSPADIAAGVAGGKGVADAVDGVNGADRRAERPATAPTVTDPMTVLREAMTRRAEPVHWRDTRAFDAHGPHAVHIVLPAALAVPRRHMPLVCLVETWVDAAGAGKALLLTVRVPAARPDAGSGIWLQSVVMLTASRMQRHWRAVAEPPPSSPTMRETAQ